MGWLIFIVIALIIFVIVWKATGHDFKFITNIFAPAKRPLNGKVERELSNYRETPDAKVLDLAFNPTSEKKGTSIEVGLKSGGKLTLTLDDGVNLLKASKKDRTLIESITEIIQVYTGEVVPDKPKGK